MKDDIKLITLQVGKKYEYLLPKINYVIDTFESIYYLNDPILISYGMVANEGVQIQPGNVENYFLSQNEEPDYSMIKWNKTKIPILFTSINMEEGSFIKYKENCTLINCDLLMSTFYFLSSWQEYMSTKKDDFGRFPFKDSFIKELNIVKIPIVNYYFDILINAIENCNSNNNISMKKKHGYGLKIGITHDIDNCQTGSYQDSYRQFISGDWLSAIKKGVNRIYNEDIWFNFHQLLKIENDLDVLSSYYFNPNNNTINGHTNADYNFQSKKIQSVIHEIETHKHEIGLHGSIGTGFNQVQFQDEIRKFSTHVFGNRFHNLLFRVKESFPILEKTGIDYDSSLGFAENIGFRNGFCFPYKPYNFEKDMAYSFYEFPFQVMDRTLIDKNYMGLPPEQAIKAITRIMNEINKFSGYFIFIWHNNTITGFKYSKWKSVFTDIIEYGKELNAEFLPLALFNSRLKNENND